MFQQYNLLPEPSGRDNILLPLDIAGRKPDPGWFDRIVDALGISEQLTRRPSELSGGQQQRIAIARALVNHPGTSTPRRAGTSCASCSAPPASSARPSSW